MVRTIYGREVLDQPGMPERTQRSIAAGERARMGDVPLKRFIADRDTASLPLTVGGVVDSALLVHRSALLDALVALFETLWRAAVPYALEPVDTTGTNVNGRSSCCSRPVPPTRTSPGS